MTEEEPARSEPETAGAAPSAPAAPAESAAAAATTSAASTAPATSLAVSAETSTAAEATTSSSTTAAVAEPSAAEAIATSSTADPDAALAAPPVVVPAVVDARLGPEDIEGAAPSPDRQRPEPRDEPPPEPASTPDNISTQRVFKKSSSNNKLTIYLGSRDIIIANRCSERVRGVVVVDPDYLQERKVFGQITLTFRYGREDEEVMGLKFCNEAIMCLAQLYPAHERAQAMANTPLQDALLRRLGPNAHPFCMEMTPLAPPSVQLVPAKEYTGAPIGTSYDVRAYVAERPEEKVNRRSMVRMGIRVLHMAPGLPHPLPVPAAPFAPAAPDAAAPAEAANGDGPEPDAAPQPAPASPLRPPHAAVDKPFLLSDGKVELEASLNKAVYNHGETVMVNVAVHNNSSRSVRRIKVFVVQHVDVCMFSNGKFKNVVALINSREQCPLGPGSSLNRVYPLSPEKGTTKNWIALEDSFARSGAPLASTVTCASNSPDDRNVFAIYVSYYVKVKLLVGAMGGELSVKLPFTLMHSSYDSDLPCLSSVPCCADTANRGVNGGADGDGDPMGGGSRRASTANAGRRQQPEETGKARMAQQMRDADVIMTCDDDATTSAATPQTLGAT